MSNRFSVRRNDPPEEQITVSDLGTDVLISVLVLAGSALAETDSQKCLTVWIAEHDRKIGAGFIGFSISEMPWEPETFDADRQFMVRVCDAASKHTGWNTLAVLPRESELFPILGWFRKRFVRLKPEDIDPYARGDWEDDMEPDDPVLCGFPRCEKHGALLTCLGCQVCHSGR